MAKTMGQDQAARGLSFGDAERTLDRSGRGLAHQLLGHAVQLTRQEVTTRRVAGQPSRRAGRGAAGTQGVAMDRKATDRAINRWLLRFLSGPASLASLLAFALGYFHPDLTIAVQPMAQGLGLENVVAQRTLGADFPSAAYLYWVVFWLTSPLNLFWLVRTGAAERVPEALRAVERANLRSRVHDPARYSLVRGYLIWIAAILVFVTLLATQLLVAHEPSYCKGCETTSVPGFIIINWGMTHMVLVGIYISVSKLVSWGDVRSSIGG